MSTSIVPPQASPTSHACSSLMPYRMTRCRPSPRARSTSSYAAPSTQPPLTRARQATVAAHQQRRALRSRRGTERAHHHRARRRSCPAPRQASSCGSSSFMTGSSDRCEAETAGVAIARRCANACSREDRRDVLEAREVVAGQEDVDERDRRRPCPARAAGIPASRPAGSARPAGGSCAAAAPSRRRTSAGSPRSQPSQTTMTMPLVRSTRRAHPG